MSNYAHLWIKQQEISFIYKYNFLINLFMVMRLKNITYFFDISNKKINIYENFKLCVIIMKTCIVNEIIDPLH